MLEMALAELLGSVVGRCCALAGTVRYCVEVQVFPDVLHARLVEDGGDLTPTLLQHPPSPLCAVSDRALRLAHPFLADLSYERDGARNIWTLVQPRS
jgi:hypothetical protein